MLTLIVNLIAYWKKKTGRALKDETLKKKQRNGKETKKNLPKLWDNKIKHCLKEKTPNTPPGIQVKPYPTKIKTQCFSW